MKADIARHVTRYDICNRIKAKHQRPVGLLNPLDILVWKWEIISMDFIVGLPRTPKGHDSIWVIIDRLTKVAHFIAMRNNYRVEKLADLYIEHILRLHVSDRGMQYVSKFWKSLHKAIGTQLDYNTAYHPQTDGQTERVNQILEIMLRACVLMYGSDWEKSLSHVEFSYNNSYQASLKMLSFEDLYGRRCRTLLM
jgi:transposase InsO family protein